MKLFVAEYEVMLQRQNTMSLLLIDLDRFKEINDTLGHNAGDEVLRSVAEKIRQSLRGADIVCRWGGEEFVVLMPATDEGNAVTIAQKICHTLDTSKFEGLSDRQVTASIAVTTIRQGDTLDEVIERADRALYVAKEAGRNTVRTA